MTWATSVFNYHKERGHVKKVGTAYFRNGLRHMSRALWYDKELDEYYVFVNGNVWNFRIDGTNEDGSYYGFI